jgi:hypothetical protein
MNLARSFVRAAVLSVLASSLALGVAACGDPPEAKFASVKSGPMPEGETWTGVYFHPVYGYLHLVEEGPSIVGRWKRADQSKWGEMSGTRAGNVVHYQWKEHNLGGMSVGAAAHSKGKGYFVYKLDAESRPFLEGQFGLDDSEVGSDWRNMKQPRMQPDLKAIPGDHDGTPTGAF